MICIREDHTSSKPSEVINSLIKLKLDGSGLMEVLVNQEGNSNIFYSNPRLSPDKKKLAYITWEHPNMPWDSTQLCIMNYNNNEASSDQNKTSSFIIAGGEGGISIMQPLWNPISGELYYLSDERNGYWIIHKTFGGENADATWKNNVR